MENDNSAGFSGAAYGFTIPCGLIEAFGPGCPGAGGLIPKLDVLGCAGVGSPLNVTLTSGQPNSAGLLFLGIHKISVPIGFGCSLLAGPLPPTGLFIPRLSPSGTFALGGAVPPHVASSTLILQMLVADAGAPGGFSSSNALEINFP